MQEVRDGGGGVKMTKEEYRLRSYLRFIYRQSGSYKDVLRLLNAFRCAVIEDCAKVAENCSTGDHYNRAAWRKEIATAIRGRM